MKNVDRLLKPTAYSLQPTARGRGAAVPLQVAISNAQFAIVVERFVTARGATRAQIAVILL